MRRLSAEEFEVAKPVLRRTIPGLFRRLPASIMPIYGERFYSPYSLYGAVAVQRLAGGMIIAVNRSDDELSSVAGEPLISRHPVNLLHSQIFDSFGQIGSVEDALVAYDSEPIVMDDGMLIRVESVLDSVRLQLGLPVEVLK